MSRIDDLIKENLSEDGTVLSLREKYIGLRGTMELFTKGDVLKNLKVLTYSGNQIGDEGAESIAECPYLANLENLILNHNEIGDEGAVALANSTNLPKVTQLSLFGNVIGDEGAVQVGRLRKTPVRWLDSSGAHHDAVFTTPERMGGAFVTMLQAFVDCVVKDRDPPVSSRDALATLAIAIAARKSIQTGAPVEIRGRKQ